MKTVVYVIEKLEAGSPAGYIGSYDGYNSAYLVTPSNPIEFMLEKDAVAIAEHKNRALALNGYEDVFFAVKKRDVEETVIPLPELSSYLEDRPLVEIEGVDEEETKPTPRKRKAVVEDVPVEDVDLSDNPDAEIEIEED